MEIPNLPGYMPTQDIMSTNFAKTTLGRLDKNLLPQNNEFSYTKQGELFFNDSINPQQGGKENVCDPKAFRVSQNNYNEFENISHGKSGDALELEKSEPSLSQLEESKKVRAVF